MDAPLDIRWSRPLPKDARPSSVTITKDQASRYFVSFLVEEEIATLPVSPKTVGIDLGLHDVVTLSTGEKTGNERVFRTFDEAVSLLNNEAHRST
jgi:putative transposase